MIIGKAAAGGAWFENYVDGGLLVPQAMLEGSQSGTRVAKTIYSGGDLHVVFSQRLRHHIFFVALTSD